MDRIVLFDGVCNFCDQSVQFIIKRDPNGYFKFASLQSEIGEKLRKEAGAPNDLDSIVLIEGKQYFSKSTAALRIARKLKGPWKWMMVFWIIPKPIRDGVYNIIAKNRYKWFGQKESCTLPSVEERERFL
ncbi:thiol-disulfide oxidoreductase DCC family protein [Bacillaceae bacterium S4-13-58]